MVSGQANDAGIADQGRGLRICFQVFVILLAIFQFSENSADVDLWGHVVFGQAMLKSHAIQRTDTYSWTAAGQPWVNHECLAEIAIGGAHALLGGPGLLLLKMGAGLLAFALALRLGGSGLAWPARAAAWALGALAVVEISYGFAARPQIFTAVCLALELVLIRRVCSGSLWPACAMPVLFALWINTHGGVLAGFGLLALASASVSAQHLFERSSRRESACSGRPVLALWLALAASAAAMTINPWGLELIRWLVRSVLWLRPEIEEWNPTPLGWDHAVLFALIAVALFSWVFTRRPRAWWEAAVCAAFALLALRSVRNTPLCAIVLLALTPAHLADALARFRPALARFYELGRNPRFQKLAAVLLAIGSAGTAVATITLHKTHPFTMEIPSSKFPTEAVEFLREHQVRGKMLVYFDWGEMVIFSLPDCPVSIDGRLDTCYPAGLIKAHWHFFNGEPFDEKVLNPEDADLALVPRNLVVVEWLSRRPDWKPLYFDNTAVVFVRQPGRFPQLAGLSLPVKGALLPDSVRVAFPDKRENTATGAPRK